MAAARRALKRNKGKDWAAASGAHRAKYLRAIAAKVFVSVAYLGRFGDIVPSRYLCVVTC